MDGDPENKQKPNINMVPGFGTILQSFWIRYSAILANVVDREFMESQFRYVLYSGIVFWAIYLFSTYK